MKRGVSAGNDRASLSHSSDKRLSDSVRASLSISEEDLSAAFDFFDVGGKVERCPSTAHLSTSFKTILFMLKFQGIPKFRSTFPS